MNNSVKAECQRSSAFIRGFNFPFVTSLYFWLCLAILTLSFGCASAVDVPLSAHLGPHTGMTGDVVHIAPLAVRAPIARELEVDLVLEGRKRDVWRAACALWSPQSGIGRD